MDEKYQNRLFAGCVIVILGLGIWLGILYRNGGNTADALELAESELDVSIAGNARLADELVLANDTIVGLKKEQRKSGDYQRELEAELDHFKDILGQLESTTESVTEGIGRVDDLAREYADLIAEGERFIADGDE